MGEVMILGSDREESDGVPNLKLRADRLRHIWLPLALGFAFALILSFIFIAVLYYFRMPKLDVTRALTPSRFSSR